MGMRESEVKVTSCIAHYWQSAMVQRTRRDLVDIISATWRILQQKCNQAVASQMVIGNSLTANCLKICSKYFCKGKLWSNQNGIIIIYKKIHINLLITTFWCSKNINEVQLLPRGVVRQGNNSEVPLVSHLPTPMLCESSTILLRSVIKAGWSWSHLKSYIVKEEQWLSICFIRLWEGSM